MKGRLLSLTPINGISKFTKLFLARKAQKIISNLLIIIAWGFFVPFADPVAQGAESNKKSLADNHPIEITADRLEAYDAKKMVLFSGNAVATQGDRVIKAEKIFLYYKKGERESGRESLRDIGKAGDLEKIEAKGHVSVSQGDRLVTGEQAVYYQDSQKIVMTGNAVMQQGSCRGSRE